jgi:hypothetical protein
MTELLDRLKDKALLKTQSFINGAWVEGEPWIEVTSPATGPCWRRCRCGRQGRARRDRRRR